MHLFRLFLTAFYLVVHLQCEEVDSGVFSPQSFDQTTFGEALAPRYLLYDVNPGEGFNLRRDVYMRVATLVRNLNEDAPWILVLPPWDHLYHWQSPGLVQERLPWSNFFDLASLRRLIPVIEFEDFLKVIPESVLEEVYYLQHYKEGWDKWEEKMDFRDCIHNPYHKDKRSGLWYGRFWGYGDQITARQVKCMSVQGHASILKPFLLKNTTARAVMIDRAETVLHDRFGDKGYWEVRRSMVFAEDLRQKGDLYRKKNLDSTDEKDGTVLEADWTQMKRKHREAKGGPYVSVHLRRGDFALSRSADVPNFENAAKQLKAIMIKTGLKKIFIATDAKKTEYNKLKELLNDFKVYQFIPTKAELDVYKDGGVAIIDQWICAHSRYFVGTRESTFSFRIQDEREILGFDPDTTFNRLCGDKNEESCEQPSRWTIVY